MNFSLKINFTVVLIIINFVSLNGFSYTFYVETSEFNDDVYIIEIVISDELTNEIETDTKKLFTIFLHFENIVEPIKLLAHCLYGYTSHLK